MTGKDLGYKPGEVEKVKFEYFPLGIVFNKGLVERDKKEGLKKIKKYWRQNWRTLKSNWRSKTNKEVNFKNVSFKNKLIFESSKIYNEIKEQNKKIDYTKLVYHCLRKHYYNFPISLSYEILLKIFIMLTFH